MYAVGSIISLECLPGFSHQQPLTSEQKKIQCLDSGLWQGEMLAGCSSDLTPTTSGGTTTTTTSDVSTAGAAAVYPKDSGRYS